MEEITVNMYINSFWRECAGVDDFRDSPNVQDVNKLKLLSSLF